MKNFQGQWIILLQCYAIWYDPGCIMLLVFSELSLYAIVHLSVCHMSVVCNVRALYSSD